MLLNAFADVLVGTGLFGRQGFMGACDLHISNFPLGRPFNCLFFLSPQNSPGTELWSVFGGMAIFLAAGRDGATRLQDSRCRQICSCCLPVGMLPPLASKPSLPRRTSAFWISPHSLFGKALFTSPVNTRTPFKIEHVAGHGLLRPCLPSLSVWISHSLVF